MEDLLRARRNSCACLCAISISCVRKYWRVICVCDMTVNFQISGPWMIYYSKKKHFLVAPLWTPLWIGFTPPQLFNLPFSSPNHSLGSSWNVHTSQISYVHINIQNNSEVVRYQKIDRIIELKKGISNIRISETDALRPYEIRIYTEILIQNWFMWIRNCQ